ncbi:MAG: fibronectin type III domain-containing protein [Minisyncoccota bacterium]
MKILNTLRILVFISTLFFALPVSAQSLDVQFEREPLFGEVNFLPGDTKSGDALVTNGTEETQIVYAESVNGFDPDGLGSQMRLIIRSESGVIYDDVFASFLSSGPVQLTELSSLETDVYTFEVSFIDSADNDYQGKSLGFDLCLGFYGGNLQCSDTVVGEENGEDNSGANRSGGGGSYSQLMISHEEAETFDISDDGVAVISWTTNKLATSRVIYGLASEGQNYPECLTGGPCYDLDIEDTPNYGYPNSSNQSQTKVTEHTVVITGLTPGENYSYRVVSSASPDTVGYEYVFTIEKNQLNEIALADMVIPESSSISLDDESSGTVDDGDEDDKEEERILGLAFLGLGGDWWVTGSLIVIVIISIWFLFRKRKIEQK